MKRFLKSVLAILRKTNETKSAAGPRRPNTIPLLEVRSRVKAGGRAGIGGVTTII
jgi:hypothetical protein